MNKALKGVLILTSLISMTIQNVKAQVEAPAKGSVAAIKEEEFTYSSGATNLKGFAAYIPNEKAKLPVVLIVPEWWGYTDYVKMRARKLAELGYLAMVVDMYGEGKVATTVEDAQKYSGEFYKNPQLGKSRLEAAEAKAKTFTQADPRRIAAIGYCFGGSMVLNAAKQGMNFKGVVSFHGGLKGVPAAKGSVQGKILVCHGGADKFISEDDIKEFKQNLDSVGAKYTFKVYPGALHAFSNPDATANGKKFNLPIAYNEEADKGSWEDMKKFLRDIFFSK